MWHVRINSPPWGNNPTLALFDDTLVTGASQTIDLPFLDMPLLPDGDHFTKTGQCIFSHTLAKALSERILSDTRILILSDSTIDFHNWSNHDEWTGWASSSLTEALAAFTLNNATIDAVCGSGFVARAQYGEHFHARLSHHFRAGFRGAVVFIGGWNDANLLRVNDVVRSIQKCNSTVERYAHA